MFSSFDCEACSVLAPQPEIESISPELEGEVLASEPPGSLWLLRFKWNHSLTQHVH